MKLHELMGREDFPTIFIDTIGQYLATQSGWQGEIVWGSHGSQFDLNFLVNSRLNLIFPASMPKKRLMPFVAEYAYHNVALRRFAQKLYINVALAAGFRYLFSHTKVHITKCSGFFESVCILPGNHSIRVINLGLNRCLVIAKKGYGVDKLKNAVSSRQAYPNLPGPEIFEANIVEGWYLEEIIQGLPVDRIGNQTRIKQPLTAAKSFLQELQRDTASLESADSWVEEKFTELDVAIVSLPDCFKARDIRHLQKVKGKLQILTKMGVSSKYQVKIALTHGDYQSANLLVPSSDCSRDVYIIDWEYSSRRCNHYDWFVYGLRSRSSKGLASRIEFLLRCDSAERANQEWYCFANIDQSELRCLLLLFLIDDFLFRLDDTSLPNLEIIPTGFSDFIKELETLCDFLCHDLNGNFDEVETSH